jgi:uncharacterized protein YegL
MATCPTCGFQRPPGPRPCPRCAAAAPPQEDLVAALEFDEAEGVPVAEPITDEAPGGVAVDLRARVEYAAVPRQADPLVRVLVDVTPAGRPAVDPASGPVAHVILALDLSASMNHADKYPVLTEALSGMLYDLTKPGSAEVLLSVVLFAYGAEVLFRDMPASRLSPRDVLAKVDASKLRFGRYTDIVGALERAGRIAYDQLNANREMPTRIYLLTDGRPQDLDGCRRVMDLIAKFPVDVDALAFGNDADVALLQQFVSGGRGGTVKQVRTETLADAFDRIAEVARRVVSNRAQIELDLAPGVVGNAAYRYRPGRHRFAESAFGGGSRFSAELGTLESGRTYSLLFEVRLPEAEADATTIGRFSLRVPAARGTRSFDLELAVPRTETVEFPPADPDVTATHDVLAAMDESDPATQLRALRVRRKLYVAERRDPHVVAVIEKAIAALEGEGSLAALSETERATLRAHTCTAGGARPVAARREFAAG